MTAHQITHTIDKKANYSNLSGSDFGMLRVSTQRAQLCLLKDDDVDSKYFAKY